MQKRKTKTIIYHFQTSNAFISFFEISEEPCKEGDWTLSSYLTLLLIGQMMHGLGGSTLITVGYSFIDDSVTAATSPLYICK